MLNFLKTFILLTALSSLCVAPTLGTENLSRARLFYNTLKPHILTFDIDAHATGDLGRTDLSPTGTKQLLESIEDLINTGEEIHFLCLAFPFKSSNKEFFVNGSLPDMAEYHSLEYLQNVIKELKDVYPKVSLTIMTDGLLFNDLFGIPDKDVIAFESHLKKSFKGFRTYTCSPCHKLYKKMPFLSKILKKPEQNISFQNPFPLHALNSLKNA